MPFASVGVKNKALGTVADVQGHFSFLDSPDLAATDSVLITCVGYQPAQVVVRQLRQQPVTIRLQKQPQTLREVVVRPQQLRKETLGHTGKTGLARWGMSSMAQDSTQRRDMRGREFGTFLTPARNCYVDNFNLYVDSNSFQEVRLRLLFYTVHDGRPAELLLPTDIQFTIPNQYTGWVTVDLRPYDLQLAKQQKIAVAMQWLSSTSTTAARQWFGVPAVFPAPLHRVFGRDKSQAEWKSFPMQPSLYLTVQSWR